ncbi:MAG: TcpQ domain-containing protein [Desulfovibrio sp.]|nr:TcpQ domain-containing protein [Desulfovibrio sp.]
MVGLVALLVFSWLVAPAPSLGAPHADAGAVIAKQENFSLAPGSLCAQLEVWCLRAHYQLVWKPDWDVKMRAHAAYGDDFVEALKTLFLRMRHQGLRLRATLFQGNRTLYVTGE